MPSLRAFLSGGGEMGALMRSHDWSATPLSSPESWPPSLQAAVSICLGTKFPIAIYWGPELALLYNDAWSSIPGEKHPWALGRPGREVWPEIWDAISALYEQVQTTGEGVWQQDQLLPMHRHGYTEECYFNFTFSPIRGEDGKVEGIFNAVVETTFRVISERRERSLRQLAEALPAARTESGVFATAMKVFEENPTDFPFCLVYVLTPTNTFELAGAARVPLDSVSFDTYAATWPLARVAEAGQPEFIGNLTEQLRGALPSGPWPEPCDEALLVPVAAAAHPGKTAAVLVAGISPRRALDDDYRAFFHRAAEQISAALANARAYQDERRRAEALAELDRAKTMFFSNVSHEFRTPLTLMMGPMEEVLAKPDGEVPPDDRALVAVAHRNGQRLLKLVNSLLDFSRMQSGQAEASYEPTDLSELTADLASNFRSAVEKAGLALTIDCPPLPSPVYVDREMWEKVVLNLISNAFKFTFEGEITVALRAEEGSAVLSVRDTGTGIPRSELPRLFDRFHRVEGAKGRSFEGSGIGLALVQELVKLHHGTVGVDSEEGHGTIFYVSLPFGSGHLPVSRLREPRSSALATTRSAGHVAEALHWLADGRDEQDAAEVSDASVSDAYAAPAGQSRARILLADDNADMRNYVQRLLGTQHHVEGVADGQAALEAARERRPDLILTDIMMPRLDGFGLIRAVRDDPQLRDIPVIALSARAGEEASVEGLSSGADDYLVKPFSARELVARVNGALAMAGMRRKINQALRESEARFRNMADNAPVMIWTTDENARCTFLGRSWYEFTGQTPETGLGFGWVSAVHPDDQSRSEKIFVAANERRDAFTLEYRLRRNDGVYRWAIDAAAPWFGDSGEFRGYIGSVIDITERKTAEEAQQRLNEFLEQRVAQVIAEREAAEGQLRQAQKMEAIGKLTGGVAHDFNNLLQVVGGNLQLLVRDVTGNDRAEQRVRNALAGVARGSKLASQLLAFGRRQPLAPRVLNLGRLIRGMDDMLRRALGEAIELDTVIAGGLWNTYIDAAQVENALLNLAINARDAMAGHGKLTIEGGNASLDAAYAAANADVEPGQYVMIAVTDTGCGIAPDVMERVFEPFFTTKSEGQGTGLGLSMVYGFVKQSGGHIKIYSEVGQGTTIRLYLPRTRQLEDVVSVVEPGLAMGGTETVLVVEDDDDVRATVVEMLTDLGYRVLKARDADSALAIIESGVPIDLLFTDVVMPGRLRSPELAQKARERLPDIAVLFTSGYTQNAIVHGGRLDDGVELLSKPYSREDMARKIRHVLRNSQQIKNSRSSAPGVADPARAVPAAAGAQAMRILLVEDEMLIRMSTADILTELGHTVFEAGNAKDALKILEEQPVDVLLTDIGLPGMSGGELATEAFRHHPKLRIVFASGGNLTPGTASADVLAKAAHLLKPYSPEHLVETLASLKS